EDGIRDLTVTGVQTCALPICGGAEAVVAALAVVGVVVGLAGAVLLAAVIGEGTVGAADEVEVPRGLFEECRGGGRPASVGAQRRSEERRVGKEGRSRGATAH